MNEDLNTQISQILADAKTIIDNQNKILSTLPNAETLKNELASKVNNDDFKTILDAMNLHLSNANFTENGYIKLPNGLIFQWGERTPERVTTNQFMFNISFPNAVFAVFTNSQGNKDGNVNINENYNFTTSGFTSYTYYVTLEKINFFAIGY